jgi:hypothetical protein
MRELYEDWLYVFELCATHTSNEAVVNMAQSSTST